MAAISPKSLLLDLLRVVPEGRDVAIRDLVAIAGLFGISGNATRVAVARLAADATVESPARGKYRLAAGAARLGVWVESWRLGERRLRPWRGGWLAAATVGLERKGRAATARALSRFGFQQGPGGLAVRPENLAASLAELRAELEAHGASGLELFAISDVSGALEASWRDLWPTASLEAERRRQSAALRESGETIARRPLARALVESFTLGGAAIRLLATDPLLPEAIAGGDARRELTDAMVAYDRLGRSIWIDALDVARAPAHLAEVAVV